MSSSSRLPPLTMVVAATLTNGIGAQGKLIWRLPEEMKWFARVTNAAPAGKMNRVIMGRKTWDSIPAKFRPLKGRENRVVSRTVAEGDEYSKYQRTTLHNDIVEAVSYPSADLHRSFLIGGAQLYNLALASPSTYNLNRVLLTRVLSPPFDDCDVFLSPFGVNGSDGWRKAEWKEVVEWVGEETLGGIEEGVRTEKGVEWTLEMWVRD